MLFRGSENAVDYVKLPNHTILYGLTLGALGLFLSMGAVTRLYELREFFPLRLPDQVSQVILDYIPFILGTFITTVAAIAGLIVGFNWLVNGLREVSCFRIRLKWAGEYLRPEAVSLGLKEGKIRSYERAPSLIFLILSRFWANARFISEIPAETVRRNVRFLWLAVIAGFIIHFGFRLLELVPPYLENLGLGSGYVVPSPGPFYNLLAMVCVFKLIIAVSLIPLRKPAAGREMDSMIVEGKGHPSVLFAVLEEGSKVFAFKGFPNRVARSKPVVCEDNETLIGTLIESFPQYMRTSARPAATACLLLGSVMILIGFLQIIFAQYPIFSAGYEDFFRLYSMSLVMDILLNVMVIMLGKGFLEQARSLMAVYRFRSSLVYVEAKGDFERQVLPDLNGIVSPERLFDPLLPCAFNVRYFSGEAVSEAVDPEGPRELVALETSGRLAKDVSRLKFLPFQVQFRERYPSLYAAHSQTEEPTELSAEDSSADMPLSGIPADSPSPVVEACTEPATYTDDGTVPQQETSST